MATTTSSNSTTLPTSSILASGIRTTKELRITVEVLDNGGTAKDLVIEMKDLARVTEMETDLVGLNKVCIHQDPKTCLR